MLAALGHDAEVRETLTEAAGPLEHVTARGVSELDSRRSLEGTVGAQLALLVVGVAGGRAAMASFGPPSALAGCDVGAFAAAVLAGVLRLDEAIPMVHLRARMMAGLFPAEDGMATVHGLSPIRAARLAEVISAVAGPLWLARVTSAEETVLAGSGQALRLLEHRAAAAGAHRVERLDGPPCHGPALRPVAAALADALVRIPDRPALFPCVGNTNGALLRTSSAVRADLTLSVATTVRWHDAMTALRGSGVEALIPTTPGKSPAPLAARHAEAEVTVDDAAPDHRIRPPSAA
jgi:malonyl CoA-acyl carrier protein transacylase